MSMVEARLNELRKKEQYVTSNLVELLNYLREKDVYIADLKRVKQVVNIWCMDNYKMDLYDSFVKIVESIYNQVG